MLKWNFSCIPHSKCINSRNTWVNLVKKSLARGDGTGGISYVCRENTHVPKGSICVRECDLLNIKSHSPCGAAELLEPCCARRALDPWGESLGLGPEGKPPSRVSGDWSLREKEVWQMEGRHGGMDRMEDDWVHVEYGLWVKWNDMHVSNDGYESGIFSLWKKSRTLT